MGSQIPWQPVDLQNQWQEQCLKPGDGYLDLNLKDGDIIKVQCQAGNWRESFNKDIKIENVEGK